MDNDLVVRTLICAGLVVAFVLAVIGFRALDRVREGEPAERHHEQPARRKRMLFLSAAFVAFAATAAYGMTVRDPEVGFFTLFIATGVTGGALVIWRGYRDLWPKD